MLTVLGVLTAMGAIDYGIVTAGLGSGLAMAMLQWFIPVLGTRRAVLNLMRDIPVLGKTKAGLTPTRFMLCTVMKPLTYLQCLLVIHQSLHHGQASNAAAEICRKKQRLRYIAVMVLATGICPKIAAAEICQAHVAVEICRTKKKQ